MFADYIDVVTMDYFSLFQIQRAKEFVHPSAWLSAVNSIDYKFLLIPLAFIFLRIWTCIVTIIFEYTDEHKKLTKMTHGCIFVDLLMSLAVSFINHEVCVG